MAMEKTGAPLQPQMGKAQVPWPSNVLVYKAEPGGFVPQPMTSSKVCLVDGCLGNILVWPDGKENCQKCGVVAKPQENTL